MKKHFYLSDLLFEFDERLHDNKEPIVLTLTEKKGFLPQEERFNKRLAISNTSNYKVVRKFDIAYNQYLLWAGAIAQNKDWDSGIISPAYPTFRVRDGYDPRFVDWLLAGESIRARYDSISFGAVPRRRRAKVTDFLSIEIPEPPPLAEQKRIAAILDAAEALRAKRRESIEQLDKLAQSVFIDMFGDPVANPKGWEVRQLPDLVAKERHSLKRGPFGGALKKEIFVPDGFKVYEQKNVIYNDFEKGKYFIDEHDYARLDAFKVIPDDLLISCSGTIGRIAVVPHSATAGVMNQALLKIRLNESRMLNSYFVGLWTSQPFERQVLGMTHGTGMKNMKSMKELKSINFISPNLDLQQRFANIVESIEAQKARYRAHLAELDTLFASLQSRAFIGEL